MVTSLGRKGISRGFRGSERAKRVRSELRVSTTLSSPSSVDILIPDHDLLTEGEESLVSAPIQSTLVVNRQPESAVAASHFPKLEGP